MGSSGPNTYWLLEDNVWVCPAGDSVTAGIPSELRIEVWSCGVELVWSNAGGPAGLATLWRWTADGDWGPVGPLHADSDERFRYRDSQVSPGSRYGYKLAVDECGRE